MHPFTMQILSRGLVVTNPGTVQFVRGNFAKASHKSAQIALVCNYRGGRTVVIVGCEIRPTLIEWFQMQ
jgi:hypothetical protein